MSLCSVHGSMWKMHIFVKFLWPVTLASNRMWRIRKQCLFNANIWRPVKQTTSYFVGSDVCNVTLTNEDYYLHISELVMVDVIDVVLFLETFFLRKVVILQKWRKLGHAKLFINSVHACMGSHLRFYIYTVIPVYVKVWKNIQSASGPELPVIVI